MKRITLNIAAAAVLCCAMTGCNGNKSPEKMKINLQPYPQTAKVDVTDNYHGTEVADPYRWLEDDNSPETAEWVKAENAVTDDYLSQIPFRNAIRERLNELWNYEKTGIPEKVGDYYFYFYNDGLQNQSVLYMKRSLDDPEPQVFLDPNTLSSEGTAALSNISFSKDGKYMAYGVSLSGSDWTNIRIKEIPSGRDLDDEIEWVKFSGANWAADSQGFYYRGYDKPNTGAELSAQNQFQRVFYHKLGTPQSADKLIYQDLNHPLRYNEGFDDGDEGKIIYISISEGTSGNELLFRHINAELPTTLLEGFDYDYTVVKTKGLDAYILTNQGAPNRHLIKKSLVSPERKVIIPEDKKNLLESVSFIGNSIFAIYLEDVSSKVVQYSLDGEFIREVPLPAKGTVAGFSGKEDATETFYALTTFTAPTAIYHYDIETCESTPFSTPDLKFNPQDFITEQVFYTSKDGTSVPMFISRHKDTKLDGKAPLYLYAYGGFNYPMLPHFSPSNIIIMEQGGIYVSANLRGGNEYGEEWHKAGMLANKQNVFDDFIAAAEYLIDHKYTSRDKIAIAGGSNGGLLVGACMTQRPDLFAVAFPQVGVLDMLRFHLFTVGWGWVVEYGSSDDPEQFEYIYKYSPLHNIKNGVCYPATLITTGDHDDRVVPAHSFKFAARLQEAQGCDKPVLISITTNAGHGAGKPTSKRIDEATNALSFFFWNTNTDYTPAEGQVVDQQ